MSTRSGRVRSSVLDVSPPRTRKGVSPPRSPARTRKSSPVTKSSPARKTSPASRPSRKSPSRKSPSRKPLSKYPARKSPSRTTKESLDNASQKSPSKRSSIKNDVSVKLEDMSKNMEIYRSTRSKRVEYSIKDVTSTTDNELNDKVNGLDTSELFGLRYRKPVEEVAPRRSSRLKEFIDSVPDIRRSLSESLSKSVSKSVSQSIDTYSDEDNSADEFSKTKKQQVTRKLATPLRFSESKLMSGSNWEFGGRIGSVLLMLAVPLLVFSILKSCLKYCTTTALIDVSSYKLLSAWFGLPAFLFIFGQYVLQAIFALTPVCGKRVDRLDNTGRKYCFNAFFASVLTLALVYLLDFYQVIDKEVLLNNYVKLATISYIFAIILSIVLYAKSRKLDSSDLNLYGNTGYGFYDFFIGREVHPYLLKLNVKIWISRICNINALILTSLIFRQGLHLKSLAIDEFTISSIKDLLSNIQFKPTILVYSSMQLTYILNFIMKEHKVTTTFFWQSEGLGYLQLVSSALYPFYLTSVSKFVADTQLVLSTNILIIASLLYVLGFFIMLVSNNIKHEFRTNPSHPNVTNLESMPTFHGKKLLVSSMWGILRHPNYTGDILMHIALALPGLLSRHYIAAIPAITTIFILVHRAWRDHSRCKKRYGAAWNRYCRKVPSVIIPKVL